jgi:hypothetical protein
VKIGFGEGRDPYTFTEAKAFVGPRLEQAVKFMDELPSIACPNNEAVVAVTLHPKFLSKSSYPNDLLKATGLRAIGSKGVTLTPRKSHLESKPSPSAAAELFIAGSRENFRELSVAIRQWSVATPGAGDMNAKVQSLWLDVLEDLPPRTVIVFTTNEPDKLSQRFQDRCSHYEFRANATDLEADANALISRIWISELGHNHAPTMADLGEVSVRGRLSFRRVVKALERQIDAVRPAEPVIVESAKPSRIDDFEPIPLEPIPLAEIDEPIIAKPIPAPAPAIEPERLDPRPIPMPIAPGKPALPGQWWHKAVRVSPAAPEPVVIPAQSLPVNATPTMRDKAIESIVLMMDCARDVAVKAADHCLAEKPHTNALTLVPAMLMRISTELRGLK